jgi:diguanylate cyclase (GGDEF)-like protein
VKYFERERQAVRKINQALARGAASHEVFQTIIEEAVRLCDAERGFLLLDKDSEPAAGVRQDGNRDHYSRGVVEKVWDEAEPLLTLDALHDPRLDGRRSIVDYNIRSVIAAPLLANHQVIGVIYLDSRSARRDFSDFELLRALADQAAVTCKLATFQLELEKQAQTAKLLSDLAAKDELTGLLNRRAFNQQMYLLLKQPRMSSLCLMMLDIDNFKEYNDRGGHLAGDNALRKLGDILRTKLRDFDVAARYGGEEFIIALPNTGFARAEGVAERLRRAISREDFTHEGAQPEGLITVSVGISCHPRHGKTMNELIAADDAALYRAKRDGKNRIYLAP